MVWIILLLMPISLTAQEFPFQQEIDTIPVVIAGFDLPSPFAPGMYASTPGFGDLDYDGDYDVLIGQWTGHVTYFQNHGSTQASQFKYVTDDFEDLSAQWTYMSNPNLVDLDNDSDLDLVYGYSRFYRNMGTPEFCDFVYDTVLIPYGNDVLNDELVDFDNDGDYDLFCGGYYGNILYAINIGSTAEFEFTVISENFFDIDVGSFSNPEFCDIDTDNDFDLFIGNGDGKIWYYRNDGDSVNYNFTLVTHEWLDIDVGAYASPEFCDIDGDGDFDLFVGLEASETNQCLGDVYFYENIGTSQNYNFQYITSNYLTMDIGNHAGQRLVDINAD
ncbi:VCBS repeat-containing protein, partial [bacterium]|nr:VCBS repeat-containing protein [bacterium]